MNYAIGKITNKILPQNLITYLNKYREFDIVVDGTIEKFDVLSMDAIYEHYLLQRDLFGYDIIPFAINDDDYLCVQFKNEKVIVIYWSTERALESRNMAIFALYESFDQFERASRVSHSL